MGPSDGLDRCGKSRPPPGSDPQTGQTVASGYTEHVTRPTFYVQVYDNYTYAMLSHSSETKVSHKKKRNAPHFVRVEASVTITAMSIDKNCLQ